MAKACPPSVRGGVRACMCARPRRGSDRAPRLRLSQAPVGPAAETSAPQCCRGKFSLLLEGMATKLTAAQLAVRPPEPPNTTPQSGSGGIHGGEQRWGDESDSELQKLIHG